MISKIGNTFLILTILSSLINVACCAFYTKSSLRLEVGIKNFFYLTCLCVISSFATLVYAFVVSDFSISNVFFNSSTIKPLIFKIAAAWASHEGSMLLWLSLLSLVSFVSIYQSSEKSANYYKIIIFSLIISSFASFIYFTSNPFDALSFAPPQGLGLNVMLQDVALAIHPPILYLGYVSYIVPFANACILLFAEKDSQISLLNDSQRFSTFGILAVTLGVGIGSWWAYRELGWGGFWFFDPVENISLLPWLSAIALYHSLFMSIKRQSLVSWTLTLSIITFLLCILGTFLVRSGMLTSIHAFSSSPERAIYLLSIFAIIAIPSIALLCFCTVKPSFYVNFSSFNEGKIAYQMKFENKFNQRKEKGIIFGNILWLLALAILLIATIYPIVFSILYDQAISIHYKYFTNIFIPVIIPTLLLAGIFSSYRNQVVFFITACVITIISSYKIKYDIVSAFAIVSSIYLILQTIQIFLIKSNYFKQSLKPSAAAMILGHLGFGLLTLSITFNCLLQSEGEFIGKIGEEINFDKFDVELKNIKYSEGVNYYRQIAEFWISDQTNNNITILKPENRFYTIEKALSQESDIYSYFAYDLYAVLNKIDGDVIHAKIYYQPMISFIWLSVFIISCGFAISLISKIFRPNHKL